VGRGEGRLENKGRAVDTRQGPEWMGICHHEQDIGLPSKWGFLFDFNARGYAQVIDYVLCKYKDGIFCVQVKESHAWSTSSCV
jgi:hypothetical protein